MRYALLVQNDEIFSLFWKIRKREKAKTSTVRAIQICQGINQFISLPINMSNTDVMKGKIVSNML